MLRGGDGVWKSIFGVVRNGRRGGVDKPKRGSGGSSRTGDSCGEAAVTKLSGISLASFCGGDGADCRDGDPPGSAGGGRIDGRATGVLVTCDSRSLPTLIC